MALLDHDIHFNCDGWQNIIRTQSKLFSPDALVALSDRLREDFHTGHPAGRTLPEIKQADWKTTLLAPYQDREIGYDLPCLLSADRPSRGRIMFCAQDPLRKGTAPGLTVGTFFGIDNTRYRHSRRHHGAIWNLIRTCVHAGYDILVTDALKIFVGKNQLWKDPALIALCFEILENEIEAFAPDRILTMGRTAGDALSCVRPEGSFLRAPHPAARGKWYLGSSTNPEDTFAKTLESYYCRLLFETDAPTTGAPFLSLK